MSLFNKIGIFFRRKQIEKSLKERIEEEKKTIPELPIAERLALASYDWVKLDWNGHKQDFLIKNINVTDMALCGRYPNIMLHFVKTAKAQGLQIEEDVEDKIDYAELKKEEYSFYEEIAKVSMLTPSFQEVYDAIIKLRKDKGIEQKIESVRDVIPYDFLEDLFRYHMQRWEQDIKKKSEKLTLIGQDA